MRTAAILLLAVLVPLGLAQGLRPTSEWTPAYSFALVVANEIDATMTDCPAQLDPEEDTACFIHSLGVDWARMDMDRIVTRFTDLRWVMPWQADGEMLFRVVMKSSGTETTFIIAIMPFDRHKAMVLVRAVP